uniref:FXYD domain-containing ion transport regulator n=1 Tax=Mastacembelus armatus TaxID=205130 RepID=A0A7N8YJ16_9TELE
EVVPLPLLLLPFFFMCSNCTESNIKYFSVSDYESLRIGGLVFAVVLFILGIVLIVSKFITTGLTHKKSKPWVNYCLAIKKIINH